jgi:hypothetical protein
MLACDNLQRDTVYMPTRRIEELPSRVLANMVTCVEMPDDDGVTERTQTTRQIGAYGMMMHLAEGEWEVSFQDEMKEFLGRVVANAARQGIALELPRPE